MMLFRHVPNPEYVPSAEDIQAEINKWQDWIGSIASQGKFVSTNQLGYEGKSLDNKHIITDGPYAEVKEIVGGYIIVKAENWEEVMDMAKGCPVLVYPESKVEVRSITPINI
ncbi:MAG: YciI family protein [Bacteroidota bacterium]